MTEEQKQEENDNSKDDKNIQANDKETNDTQTTQEKVVPLSETLIQIIERYKNVRKYNFHKNNRILYI